ncbi:hypothetical protein F4813DRAFT_393737 [Daldinia decipiens]|uniref:uncharacterized protein n=1 Tax=Daldinia decipiens TaxID=326647 RepID=UPI0020C1EFCF|nr:uncharacterized protein F4813DRAFT_393737 [Daldinia decipiens]KAI1653423.1 hypothetical protein F4813DRAFT_393737 [Daldinia decipiens]
MGISGYLAAKRETTTKSRDHGEGKTKGFPPAVVGLSVSVGYMLGGLLPLFLYFFVSQVADGLRWSFAVCVLALFVFGFAKDYLLHNESVEGMRIVVMGGITATAAVLCVKLFEGVSL